MSIVGVRHNENNRRKKSKREKNKQTNKQTNKQRQKTTRQDRSYSERVRAKWFCCAFKLIKR